MFPGSNLVAPILGTVVLDYSGLVFIRTGIVLVRSDPRDGRQREPDAVGASTMVTTGRTQTGHKMDRGDHCGAINSPSRRGRGMRLQMIERRIFR